MTKTKLYEIVFALFTIVAIILAIPALIVFIIGGVLLLLLDALLSSFHTKPKKK